MLCTVSKAKRDFGFTYQKKKAVGLCKAKEFLGVVAGNGSGEGVFSGSTWGRILWVFIGDALARRF